MRFLAVDDEAFELDDLEEVLREVMPDCELACFTRPSKALQYAASEAVDVAFLDIELGSINGLVLAKQLKDIQPDMHIIFVTGFDRYALGAFKIHATGYLIKPAIPEDIRRELTFLYGDYDRRKKVRVQTFGGFDVFVEDKPLVFGRSKSRELLAYLIDRRGNSVTTGEACAVLWEDESGGLRKRDYFRVVIMELKKVLKAAGVSDILVVAHNSFAINPELLDCDSYRFMQGDPEAVNNYRHDYMLPYSWAEFTFHELERRKKR